MRMTDPAIRAVVTDIEGTTSSLSFVKDVLFPFARRRMAGFVQERAGDPAVRRLLADTAQAAGRPLRDDEAVLQLLAWMDEDRKATPLKALQGLIWEEGYRSGAFVAHVYEDAVRRLREWRERGLGLYVYSSGSVHAQQLLFGHTAHGDLTPLFAGWFDTRIGAKQEAESYRRIADAIGLAPEAILFLSDVTAELDAAAAVGLATCLLVREGQPETETDHLVAQDFDEISP
jgi:enolase-phosphatase E1